jgi:RNA polymerase sigma factor (TIGR02999 family)
MTASTVEFHRLLGAVRLGDPQASARLVALVYDDLRRLARAQLGYGASNRTMNTTSLVHECYMQIMGPAQADVESKNHFFNLASKVMRQVLCDYARERLAEKRGGGMAHDTLSAVDIDLHQEASELVELDDLLNKLERDHPSYARVFECRYFAGLSEQETADALNLSLRTAQREWNQARQWLSEKMAA